MRNNQQNGELEFMEPNDEMLMTAYQQGDQTALAGLVRRYADSLLGYLTRLCMQRQQAEDVFQETFLRIHRKAGSFRAGSRFKPWLYAIATHLAIDNLRCGSATGCYRRSQSHQRACCTQPRRVATENGLLRETRRRSRIHPRACGHAERLVCVAERRKRSDFSRAD